MFAVTRFPSPEPLAKEEPLCSSSVSVPEQQRPPARVREAWANRHTYDLVKRYMTRPAEELYHTAEDPYEMTNLADDPAAAEIKARLSAELDSWMQQQGDPGAPQDTSEAIQAARRGKHLYGTRPKP